MRRFADAVMVLGAHGKGQAPSVGSLRIGTAFVFERSWKETGCRAVLASLLVGRKSEFPAERAVPSGTPNAVPEHRSRSAAW